MILLRIEMFFLFKVTAWEKVSPARRLLVAFGRVMLLFAGLLLIGYALFAHRYAIEARVWHWRHGYSATVDGYEIPVPARWLILIQEHEYITMVNTAPNPPAGDSKIYAAPVVTVTVGLFSHARVSDWTSTWESVQRKRSLDNKVPAVVDKTLNFADESFRCFGGNELDTLLLADRPDLPRTGVVSLDCLSTRGLDARFVGEPSEVESFYRLLSQVRRRK
jgi:hypothetical protein